MQWGSTRKGKGGPIGKGPQNAALRSIDKKHTQGLSWLSYYRHNSYRWLQRSHIGHYISNNKSFNAYVIGWYRSFSLTWQRLALIGNVIYAHKQTRSTRASEPLFAIMLFNCLSSTCGSELYILHGHLAIQGDPLSLSFRVVHTACSSGHSGWPPFPVKLMNLTYPIN